MLGLVELNWMCFIFSPCRISLNTMTLQVESPTVYTSQGVPISVTGIAQVRYIYKTVLSVMASKAMVMTRAILFMYYHENCGSLCHRRLCFARIFWDTAEFLYVFLLHDVSSCPYNFNVSCLKLDDMFWWLFCMCLHVGGVVAQKGIGTNFVAVFWPTVKSHFVCHIWVMLHFILAVKECT